jgi:hypothetical protein
MCIDCNSRDSGEQKKSDQDKESDGKSRYMPSDDVIALRWVDRLFGFMDMPDLVCYLAFHVTDHFAGLIFDALGRVCVGHICVYCHFPVPWRRLWITVTTNTTPA